MTDISNQAYMVVQLVAEATAFISAPHTRMRPRIYPDGNQWCALYGVNLQEGVAGFGDTPDKACADFDRNWYSQKLRHATTETYSGGNREHDGGTQP
ncbi:MAG: hypothetical protein EBR82_48280 [Caulobacteraceae bacterium]|nr:hypothetical protein [Caulobacteraceae bacterium]